MYVQSLKAESVAPAGLWHRSQMHTQALANLPAYTLANPRTCPPRGLLVHLIYHPLACAPVSFHCPPSSPTRPSAHPPACPIPSPPGPHTCTLQSRAHIFPPARLLACMRVHPPVISPFGPARHLSAHLYTHPLAYMGACPSPDKHERGTVEAG